MKVKLTARTLLLCFSLILLLLPVTKLHAGCSPYIGLATINEINTHNQSSSGDYYVEVKALDSSIINSSPTLWNGWTLDLCSEIGAIAGYTCKNNIPISGGTLINNWLVIDQNTLLWDYIDLNQNTGNKNEHGMEIILRDANDDIVDYFSVAGYSVNGPEGCSFPYDTDYAGGNGFNLQRMPDGIGDWASSGGGDSGTETPTDSNDPVPPSSPQLRVADTSITAGSGMVFTFTLNTTSSTNVVISYATKNGTAIAGSDYTAKSGSLTIPAGSTSGTVTVTTSSSGAANSYFYLVISQVTSANAIIMNNLAKGTLLAYASINHYRFYHDGSGLTCSPENVQVKACLDTNCTSEFVGSINADFSPTGWVGGDTKSFLSSATLQLWHTTAETATLAISGNSSQFVPQNTTRCFVGTTQQANCSLTFLDSGFIFDVPNHIAAAPQTVTLSAVRKDVTTQQCLPGFQSVTRSINFHSTYLNPTIGSLPITINGTTIAGATPGTNLNLAFNASGQSSILVNYADVGQKALNASYVGSGVDAGLTMTGVDNFITRPDHFVLTIPGNSAAADASGSIFKTAGEAFPVEVRAVNALGATTPNFGKETTAESVGLTNTLIAPAGKNNPAIAGSFNAFGTNCAGTSVAGTACGSFSWNEVGIISLLPGILDGNYLGSGNVTGTSSGNVGRFVPNNFRMLPALTISGVLNDADGAFSYYGHEINGYTTNPSGVVEAVSVSGTRTTNYQGTFFKLTPASLNITSPVSDKMVTTQPLSITRAGASLISHDDGTATYLFGEDKTTYTRAAAATAPISTPQFDFTVTQISDAEVTSASSHAIPVSGGTELRYGRLLLENSFGPETEPISMSSITEYWDGSQWQLNIIDSTSIYSYTKVENDITTTEEEAGIPVSPSISNLSIIAGAGSITLVPATDPNDPGGTVDVTLGAPDWLKFDWDDNLTTPDSNPTATASFGIYRGRDRIISWEELPAH